MLFQSMIKNGHPWTSGDTALLAELPTKDQAMVIEWIRTNLVPAENSASASSYGLKHRMQTELSIYTTNNQFKDAMLRCGFRPERNGELYWRYSLHRRSPVFVNAHPHSKRGFFCQPMTVEDDSDPHTFYGWMMHNHHGKNTPEGDFASDMYYDLTWPHLNDFDTIIGYLHHVSCCKEAMSVFLRCWRDYSINWVDGVVRA